MNTTAKTKKNSLKINSFDKIFVIDTNIVLQDAYNLHILSQNGSNLIVMPETVLDELDAKKSGWEEINFQARELGRLLEGAETIGKEKLLDDDDMCYPTVYKKVDNEVFVAIISKDKYSTTKDDAPLNILNDRKILEVAKFCQNHFKNKKVIFISLDVMARIRAVSMDLNAESLKAKYEEYKYAFVKELFISGQQEKKLNSLSIFEVDPEHKTETSSYVLTSEESGRTYLCVVKNDMIEIISDKDLKDQMIVPKNKEQLFFSHAIQDNYFNLIVTNSKAGTGKTACAISNAMKLIQEGEFSKLVYIRNSIESVDKGAEIGFLKGDQTEKLKIYNYPLYDTLEFIARENVVSGLKTNKGSKAVSEEDVQTEIKRLMTRFGITTMWLGEMRGRTVRDAVIVIDEGSNLTVNATKLALSRVTDNCKVIFIGSNMQIDSAYLNKYTNGLTATLAATRTKHPEINVFGIELVKVVRGKMTEFAERFFDQNSKR